jgi:hypothetical protein
MVGIPIMRVRIPPRRLGAWLLCGLGACFVVATHVALAQSALLLSATPATISFAANTPGSNIAGSAAARITFSMDSGSGLAWTLKVGTAATKFTGCTTVPTSAVSVRCASATTTGGASGATAACGAVAFTTLPSSIPGLQVANGQEPSSGSGIPFTINLNYQLADSWQFVANTCPLTVTYTVTAP